MTCDILILAGVEGTCSVCCSVFVQTQGMEFFFGFCLAKVFVVHGIMFPFLQNLSINFILKDLRKD